MDPGERTIQCPISWYIELDVKMRMLTCIAGQGTNGLSDAGRAATVIHEATHQLAKTGDEVNQKGNIIKAYDSKSIPTGETGCACPTCYKDRSRAHSNLGHRYERS